MRAARVSLPRSPALAFGQKGVTVGLFFLSLLAGCSADLGKLRASPARDAASSEAPFNHGPDAPAVARDSVSIESLASDGPQAMEAASWDSKGQDGGLAAQPDGSIDRPSQDDGSSVADRPLDIAPDAGGPDGPLGTIDAPVGNDGESDAERTRVTDSSPADATGMDDGGDGSAGAPGNDGGAQGPVWIKIASSSPQHLRPAVGYDPALQRAALFGGHTDCMEYQATNQTWEWDGAAWTKVTPTGQIPSARGAVGMAFDGAHGEAIIHGGWAQPNFMQTGTYAYNLGTHAWASRGGPPNLGWYAIDYDSDAGLVRLFGGSDNRTFFREVRTWITSSWQNQNATGPVGRARHGWVFDQEHHVFVMFGGVPNWFAAHFADTWEYDPAANAWQQTAITGTHPSDCDTPPPMVYDPHRKLVVMYCYTNGGETWEYDAGAHAWSKTADASTIGLISGASLFYDMKLRSVLLVGGCKSGSPQDGTWQYIPIR